MQKKEKKIKEKQLLQKIHTARVYFILDSLCHFSYILANLVGTKTFLSEHNCFKKVAVHINVLFPIHCVIFVI